MDTISHIEAQHLLQRSISGGLPRGQRDSLYRHLATCETCRLYRSTLLDKEHKLKRSLQSHLPHPQFSPQELQEKSAKIQARLRWQYAWHWLGTSLQTLAWSGLAAGLIFGLAWVLNNLAADFPQPAATAVATPSQEEVPPTENVLPPGREGFASDGPATPFVAAPPISRQLRMTLNGHAGPVISVAFSPDSRLLASASEDGSIRLWRVRDGALIRTMEGHTKAVTSVVFSPDGTLLVSGGKDGMVKLWNPADGTFIKTLLEKEGSIKSLSFSPNGELIAVSLNEYRVLLVRVSDGTPLDVYDSQIRFDVNLMGDNNGYLIASAESAVWLQGGSNIPFALNMRGQSGKSLDVTLSGDGSLLASSSTDGNIYVWRIFDLVTYHEPERSEQDLFPERSIFGQLIATLAGHDDWVTSVDFDPQGRYLVSGSKDGRLILWALPAGVLADTLSGHRGPINSMDVSPDGLYIASGSDDGSVRIWSLAVYK